MNRNSTLRALGLAGAVLCGTAGALAAENRAVVITNANYVNLPAVPQVDAKAATDRLKSRGFRVVEGADLNTADLRTAIGDLLRADADPGERIVVLKGRFVHSRGETWLLGRDAVKVNAVTAGLAGIPLSTVIDLIAQGNPRSVLLLGTDDASFDVGAGLSTGWGRFDVPANVRVIGGYTAEIGRAADIVARQGGTIDQALKQGDSLKLLSGQAGSNQPVVISPGGNQPVVVPPPGSQPVVVPPAGSQPVVVPPAGTQPVVVEPPRRLDDVVQPSADEQAAWTRAKRANSVAGYREFLGKYPNSIFAGAARGRMDELTAASAPRQSVGAATEAALNLSRAQRAQIQRQLTLLNYDTRGIDGSFGPSTRSAISRFQQDKRAEVTGYLNAAQVKLLGELAAQRSRKLEAEAQQRQRANDEADSRYWTQQRTQGPEGAQRYLSRYPNGIHEDAARAVLADAARRFGGGKDVEAAWQRTVAANRPDAYRAFITNNPGSRYEEEARRRIAAGEKARAQDQAYEAQLDLPPQVRLIVEQRLAQQGFKVGKVDGKFDRDTRHAISRYQSARNLRASGYLNQSTVIRLLGDALVARD